MSYLPVRGCQHWRANEYTLGLRIQKIIEGVNIREQIESLDWTPSLS